MKKSHVTPEWKIVSRKLTNLLKNLNFQIPNVRVSHTAWFENASQQVVIGKIHPELHDLFQIRNTAINEVVNS